VRGHAVDVRLVFPLFLAACGMGTDDVFNGAVPDATASDVGFGFPDVFLPGIGDVGPPEPVFNGGPLACGKCTCDGTLYACLMGAAPDGGCSKGTGGPPAPITGDAGDDADATCGNGLVCARLPVECLPKPTCACITKALGLACTIDPSGNGFTLQCATLTPWPPP
jgi:hypothetical protein